MIIYLATREELFKNVREQGIGEEARDLSIGMTNGEADDKESRAWNGAKCKFVARLSMPPMVLSNKSILGTIGL